MSDRNEKVANYIKERTAEFLQRENNGTSLITVTSATCSPDLKRATVFITVLPLVAVAALGMTVVDVCTAAHWR